MGTLVNENTFGEALRDYSFQVPNTPEYREFLQELGYEKRSGSAASTRPVLTIAPFRMWFWEDTGKPSIKVEKKRITYFKVEKL